MNLALQIKEFISSFEVTIFWNKIMNPTFSLLFPVFCFYEHCTVHRYEYPSETFPDTCIPHGAQSIQKLKSESIGSCHLWLPVL